MNDLQNYPTKKVILVFSLLGGAIGGTIFIIVKSFVILITHYIQTSSIEIDLKDILLAPIFGTILGFLPAFFTGLTITSLELTKSYLTHYLTVFLIGIITSAIVGMPLQVITAGGFSFEYFVIYVFTGGVSSLILAKFVLPKAEK